MQVLKAVALASAALFVSHAAAQDSPPRPPLPSELPLPDRRMLPPPPPMPQHWPGGRGVQIQTTFEIVLPVGASDPDTLTAVLASGRGAAYEAAARDCRSLIDTIASDCAIEGVSVSTAVRRDAAGQSVRVNARASYRIRPRDR